MSQRVLIMHPIRHAHVTTSLRPCRDCFLVERQETSYTATPAIGAGRSLIFFGLKSSPLTQSL